MAAAFLILHLHKMMAIQNAPSKMPKIIKKKKLTLAFYDN